MPDATSPPSDPAPDNTALDEVADGYADILGDALIAWLKANADLVRSVLDSP